MPFEPNTTPTPNWLYNGEMKKMGETELKVVLLVTRKTLGWFDPTTGGRKSQDYISQSQFIEFTGQSNRAIATAIQSCVSHGWIVARDSSGDLCDSPEKRARRKVWYQLGSIFISKLSGEESSLDEEKDKNLVKKVHQSGEHFDTNLVKKVHSTKETLTKETLQKKEGIVADATTPSQEAVSFFNDLAKQDQVSFYLSQKGIPEQIAQNEVRKFISYWTEPNKTGKKQRWEMEKTFEIKRRLITWMSRIRGSNQETKGITL